MSICDIFVAVAYGPACVENSRYRRALEMFLKAASENGISVYIAPANECWGTSRPPRRAAIAADHEALRRASCFVYFTGGFDSDGALVELGMALGWKKRIIVVRWDSNDFSSHVKGLIDIEAAAEYVLPAEPTADELWPRLLLKYLITPRKP